jgi:hypothetical protein
MWLAYSITWNFAIVKPIKNGVSLCLLAKIDLFGGISVQGQKECRKGGLAFGVV